MQTFLDLWDEAKSAINRLVDLLSKVPSALAGHGHVPARAINVVQSTHSMMINGHASVAIIQGKEILSRPTSHVNGGPMYVDGAYSTTRSTNAYLPVLGYQLHVEQTSEGQVV